MPKEPSKMKSWQIFHFFRKHIGSPALYSIFGTKNARTVDYWCQDPMYTNKSDNAHDPIKGVKQIVDILDSYGHVGIARALIAYLCSGTSIWCEMPAQIVEPRQSICEEILLDYKAVASLQAAIERGAHPDDVESLMRAALSEVERTFAKYHFEFHK